MPKGQFKNPKKRAEKISESQKKGAYFKCTICKKIFWRKPYEIKNGNNKFCSKDCYSTWQRGRKRSIKFCINCDYCIREKRGCVHKDDLQELYPKVEKSKFLLLGTPVFQGNLSGQLKTVMDRMRALVAKNPGILKNKIGMALAVGGDRSGGQEIAIRSILDFYQQNHVISVSGGAFGANLGACLWSNDRGKDGVENDEEGLRAIRKVIKRMAELKKLI